MGLYISKKNAEVETIYSAYGITLKGIYNYYESCFDDLSCKVITTLFINDIEIYLGNNFIFGEKLSGYINMEDDKKLLCFYLSKHPIKSKYELETFFLKGYRGTLWRYIAQNEMFLEKQKEIDRQIVQEREKERNEKIAEYRRKAEKKNLYMIVNYDTVYFLKINTKRHGDISKYDDAKILDFAVAYPGNECDIVEKFEL